MATANLRDELSCSICLDVYTDPVTLRCGHNFCRVCIDGVLGSQEGVYSCPECREEFQERPALSRNITLRNIIARCVTSLPEEPGEEISCTYCVHSPVAAVRSCLHCEASLCEDHLRNHSKSPEHVLSAPSTSLQSRKCSVHKKVLEYFCTQDDSCICVTCCLAGEHAGHKVEQLTEASNKKIDLLKTILTTLLGRKAETEERVQSLQERRRTTEERATRATETFTAMFRDIRRRVDDLEQKVLSEISRQEQLVTNSVYDLIQQLETKKERLSGKMSHIEKLCTMDDPLMVLKEQESGREDFCDTEEAESEERRVYDEKIQGMGGLEERAVSVILQSGLADIVSSVSVEEEKTSDMVLDLYTCFDHLNISDKHITWRDRSNKWPQTPERFQTYPQALSTKTVSSGKHYWEWEIDINYSKSWSVGMSYPSMDRKGEASCLGFNTKSWCLWVYGGQCSVVHDSRRVYLPYHSKSHRFRMCLDYEAAGYPSTSSVTPSDTSTPSPPPSPSPSMLPVIYMGLTAQ